MLRISICKKKYLPLYLFIFLFGLYFIKKESSVPQNKKKTEKVYYKKIASTSLASDEILIDILSKSNKLNRLLAISTLSDSKEYSNVTEIAKKIPYRTNTNLEKLI